MVHVNTLAHTLLGDTGYEHYLKRGKQELVATLNLNSNLSCTACNVMQSRHLHIWSKYRCNVSFQHTSVNNRLNIMYPPATLSHCYLANQGHNPTLQLFLLFCKDTIYDNVNIYFLFISPWGVCVGQSSTGLEAAFFPLLPDTNQLSSLLYFHLQELCICFNWLKNKDNTTTSR